MSKTTKKVIELAEEELNNSSTVSRKKEKSEFPTLKAIACVQQECQVIHKTTQGYGYTYADLSAIYKELLPLMKKHNIAFIQPIVGTNLKTKIYHTKDESAIPVEEIAEIPQGVQLKGMNTFQVYGSAITYFRRYCLSSFLGIITDKDIDACGKEIKSKESNIKIKKPILPVEKMKDVIKKLQNKEITIETVKKHYSLTDVQLNTLKLC